MAARENTAQPAGLHLSLSEEGKTARSSQGEKTNTSQKSESIVHLMVQCVLSVLSNRVIIKFGAAISAEITHLKNK